MIAARNRLIGLIPSGANFGCKMENPAGFGASAMTVNPPPDITPATKAYLNVSLTFGSWGPRQVMAAFSVKAVSNVYFIRRTLNSLLYAAP
jgi:hypothetical protein